MRSLTGPESTLLAAPNKRLAYKVEVQDEAAAWQEYTDWTLSISGNESIDDPIPTLNVELRRDHDGDSLSPFRGDSPLNSGGAAIDVGRGIRIKTAYATWGTTPAGGDFNTVFIGTIDRLDFSQPNISIQARLTVGARLINAWIREPTEYGDEAGLELETVIQDIIDDWAPGITLEVPSAPGFMVDLYEQQPMSVWDAIRELAGLIGWDIRFLWDSGSSEFRPTLIEPDRTATSPVWTYGPDDIYSVDQLSIDRTFLRNSFRVTYVDEDGEIQYVDGTDPTSIARFEEQWAEIIRGHGSPINTLAEAEALRDAALADMAWPIADQVVQVPYNWAVELGDLERFSANGIHYDDDQDLAATGHRWEIRPGTARSFISVRGKPAGFYLNWLSGNTPIVEAKVTPELAPGVIEEDQGTALATFSCIVHDPAGFATRLLYKKRVGGAAWPSTWTVKTSSPVHGDEYSEDVAMIQDHPSQIMWGLEYDIPDVVEPGDLPIFALTSPAFDLGLIANITGASIEFEDDGEAVITAIGDFDTRDNGVDPSIIFTVGEDADPADPTIGAHDGELLNRSGTALSGVVIATGSYAHVKLAAVNETGDVGPVFGPITKRRAMEGEAPDGTGIQHFVVWRANTTVGSAINMKTTFLAVGETGWYVTLQEYDTYAETSRNIASIEEDTDLDQALEPFTVPAYLQAAKNAGDLSVDLIYTLILYDDSDVEMERMNYTVTLIDVDEPA